MLREIGELLNLLITASLEAKKICKIQVKFKKLIATSTVSLELKNLQL